MSKSEAVRLGGTRMILPVDRNPVLLSEERAEVRMGETFQALMGSQGNSFWAVKKNRGPRSMKHHGTPSGHFCKGPPGFFSAQEALVGKCAPGVVCMQSRGP